MFRSGPADAEPFGLWLGYLLSREGRVVYVDLQSSIVWDGELRALIATYEWDTAPREEVFFAPFKS